MVQQGWDVKGMLEARGARRWRAYPHLHLPHAAALQRARDQAAEAPQLRMEDFESEEAEGGADGAGGAGAGARPQPRGGGGGKCGAAAEDDADCDAGLQVGRWWGGATGHPPAHELCLHER